MDAATHYSDGAAYLKYAQECWREHENDAAGAAAAIAQAHFAAAQYTALHTPDYATHTFWEGGATGSCVEVAFDRCGKPDCGRPRSEHPTFGAAQAATPTLPDDAVSDDEPERPGHPFLPGPYGTVHNRCHHTDDNMICWRRREDHERTT